MFWLWRKLSLWGLVWGRLCFFRGPGSPKLGGEKLFPTFLKKRLSFLCCVFWVPCQESRWSVPGFVLWSIPLGKCICFYACTIRFLQDSRWNPEPQCAKHDLWHWVGQNMTFATGFVVLVKGGCLQLRFACFLRSTLVSGVFVVPESQNIFSISEKGALQLGICLGQCGHLNNANPSNPEHRQGSFPFIRVVFSCFC